LERNSQNPRRFIMQDWLVDKLVETRREDFRREMEQINLMREAQNAYDARQSWLQSQLHHLGHWMVTTGERLHTRYHAPEPLPRWYQGSTLAR
jgi:hypothetical protein